MGSSVNGDTSNDHNGTKFTISNTKGNIELNNSAAAGSIKIVYSCHCNQCRTRRCSWCRFKI